MTLSIDPQYQEVLAAWERAEMIKGVDPSEVRKDMFGRVIWFAEYDQKTEHGWHIIVVDPTIPKTVKAPRREAVQWQPFPSKQLKAV